MTERTTDAENQFYGMAKSELLGMIDIALKSGDRVEIIPIKNGIKLMRVKRKEIKSLL